VNTTPTIPPKLAHIPLVPVLVMRLERAIEMVHLTRVPCLDEIIHFADENKSWRVTDVSHLPPMHGSPKDAVAEVHCIEVPGGLDRFERPHIPAK